MLQIYSQTDYAIAVANILLFLFCLNLLINCNSLHKLSVKTCIFGIKSTYRVAKKTWKNLEFDNLDKQT